MISGTSIMSFEALTLMKFIYVHVATWIVIIC